MQLLSREIDPNLVAEMRQIEKAEPIEITMSVQRAVLLCRMLQGEAAMMDGDEFLDASRHTATQLYTEIHTKLGDNAPKLAAWLKKLKDGPDSGCMEDADEIWWEAYPEGELP